MKNTIIPRLFKIESDSQRDLFARFLGKQTPPFEVAFGPLVEKRTLKQNARLFALHSKAAAITGYSVEELHEEMLCQHYGFTEQERRDMWTGEITRKKIPLQRSRASNTKEFARFMEFCEMSYGEHLGIWLGVNE